MKLHKLNGWLEKAIPITTPASLLIGFVLTDVLQSYVFLVPWVFACMTFSGSVRMSFRDILHVMAHPLPLLLALIVLHVLMPLAAWGMGSIFFPDDAYTVTGLILIFAIPTGITSLVWVTIYRGHVALSLAIVLIDTLLSPFLVPFSIQLLVGEKIDIDILGLMSGLFWMVVLPSLLGMTLHQISGGKIKEHWAPRLSIIPKVGVIIVILINSAAVAQHITQFDVKIAAIALIVLTLTCLAYFLGALSGKWIQADPATITALSFNTGMRNIAAGIVLAVTYFPPSVAIPVLAGTLVQQILASCWGKGLHAYFQRKKLQITASVMNKQL